MMILYWSCDCAQFLAAVDPPDLGLWVELGPGLHVRGVRAVVGLRQPEAAHDLAPRQPRQVLLALLLAAEVPDGVHHQGGLHRHRRPGVIVTKLLLQMKVAALSSDLYPLSTRSTSLAMRPYET